MHMEKTDIQRDIYTERICRRREVHLKGHIHISNIQMKKPSNKGT